jgi:hypothetical protein
VVCFDGTEVRRINLPAGIITAATLAAGDGAAYAAFRPLIM